MVRWRAAKWTAANTIWRSTGLQIEYYVCLCVFLCVYVCVCMHMLIFFVRRYKNVYGKNNLEFGV